MRNSARLGMAPFSDMEVAVRPVARNPRKVAARWHGLVRFLLALFFCLKMSFAASGAQIFSLTLAWEATPPEDQIAGYRVYVGDSPGVYNRSNTTSSVTQYTVTNLTRGNTYFFAVAAYNSFGFESELSSEIMVVSSAITRFPPNIEVAWSETGTAGFVLEGNDNIALTNNWLSVPPSAFLSSGGMLHFITPASSGRRFYRLRPP